MVVRVPGRRADQGSALLAAEVRDLGRVAGVTSRGKHRPQHKHDVGCEWRDGLSVAYLYGLLNSELLDLWYAVRGKTPRDIWHNYEPKPMARIPYRHVESRADEGSDALSPLAEAIADEDSSAALVAVEALRLDPVGDGEIATAIEILVRAIADNRRDLLPLRALDPGLGRVIKNPWRTGPVRIDLTAAVATLSPAELISVRLDPALQIRGDADGVLGRHEIGDGSLSFTHSRKRTATVVGDPDRLAKLASVIGSNRRLQLPELEAIELPKDLASFDELVSEREAEIRALLDHGIGLVEAVERLVCHLYAVSPDLENEIIASAVTRAATDDAPDDL